MAVSAQNPLSSLVELSASTFFYDPPVRTERNPASPKLILIFSWYAAKDVHIAKYVSHYLDAHPSSRLVLVKCPIGHTFTSGAAEEAMKPAIHLLHQTFDAIERQVPNMNPMVSAKDPPQVLIHVFSNGGAMNFARFLDLWRVKTANDLKYGTEDEGAPLAPHVLVLDSCPGKFHWMLTHKALGAALPPWLGPLLHFFIAWYWLLHVPFGRLTIQARFNAALNREVTVCSEKRRTYIYSREDEMVSWQDIEDHCADAVKEGVDVRVERFEGSGHVAHMRSDPDRYWGIVKETWEGKPGE